MTTAGLCFPFSIISDVLTKKVTKETKGKDERKYGTLGE